MAERAKVHTGQKIRMVKTRVDGTQVDLGVVSADYEDPVRRLWWQLIGKPLADRRIRAENRRSQALRRD